jgi:four helix bundle protein
MSRIEKFEDLIAWQKARILAKEIYAVTEKGEFSKDFGLKSQIQRASVSIMSNIAEGFDRAGRSEFHHYLVIAKGSCAEVKSQLYIANDIGYISMTSFNKLKGLADEISLIIGGLRSAVHKQRKEQ